MLAFQLHIKVTKLSRRSTSMGDTSARPWKAALFIRSMCRYDARTLRACRRCLQRLQAGGVGRVAIYGANDIARALTILAAETSIVIGVVYDDFCTGQFAGHEVRPLSRCHDESGEVILAALVGIEDRIERLLTAGFRGRLVMLEPGVTGRTAVSHDADLTAPADESPASSCQPVV
jgi:hypothetical protein